MPDNFFDDIEMLPDNANIELANESLFADIDTIQKIEEPVKHPVVAPKKAVAAVKEAPKEEEAPEEKAFDANEFFGGNEEEEKPVETESSDDETEEEEKPEEVNTFEALSNDLYESGVFDRELDEEGNDVSEVAKTPEEFKKLFEGQSRNRATKWVDGFLGQFGDTYKDAFQAIYINGVDPKQYFSSANEIESLANINLESEDNQKRVVREFYKRSKMSEDKIQKRLQWLVDTAHLEDEATDMLPQLLEQEGQKLAELEEQSKLKIENDRRADAEYKASLTRLLTDKIKAKEFDGIPVSEKVAQRVFDLMYSKKWKTPDGKLMTDLEKKIIDLNRPENLANKLKLALLLDSDLDTSKIQTRAVSKQVDSLFASVTKQKSPNKKTTSQKSTWGESL